MFVRCKHLYCMGLRIVLFIYICVKKQGDSDMKTENKKVYDLDFLKYRARIDRDVYKKHRDDFKKLLRDI